MKIALFSDSYPPLVDGIASSLSLLNEQFLQMGHQVIIFAPGIKGSRDEFNNVIRVKALKVRDNPPYYVTSPLPLRPLGLLRRCDFDIVHAHTPLTLGLFAYQASRLFDKPFIFTYHTMVPDYLHYIGWWSKINLVKKGAKYFELIFCNGCSLIVAPSVKVKDYLHERGVSKAIEVVPNGIKLDRYKGAEKGYLRLRCDNIKATDKVLLAVGRLGQEKNPSFLIKTLARLVQHLEQVKLVFAGSGYLLSELIELATEMKVKANVIFLGNVLYNEMPALYADADILVSAATTEVHPMALLEAIGSGLPVVAIEDQAFASAVLHGKNGFLVTLDEQLFAGRLLEILQNPALQQTMSAESLRISSQFSVEAQANKLLDIYERVITRDRERTGQIRSRYPSF